MHVSILHYLNGSMKNDDDDTLTWRVNDIDMSILPHAECSGTFDGDALLSFQIHAIHLRTDPVFSTYVMDGGNSPSVIEDAFGEGGLAAIDVGRYSNVTSLNGVVDESSVGGGGKGVTMMNSSISRMHRSTRGCSG